MSVKKDVGINADSLTNEGLDDYILALKGIDATEDVSQMKADKNAAWADFASNAVYATGQTVASIVNPTGGGGDFGMTAQGNNGKGVTVQGDQQSMYIIIAVAVLVILIFKRK
ncbi:MAG: hypothetical protein ACYDEX_21965 [Mobilitalea sp.]